MATCETHGHLYRKVDCIMCGKDAPHPEDPLIVPLRDQFAMAAMPYVWGGAGPVDGMVESAKLCYRMADAMLKARIP